MEEGEEGRKGGIKGNDVMIRKEFCLLLPLLGNGVHFCFVFSLQISKGVSLGLG